ARQRLQVDNLFRRDAPVFEQLLAAEFLPFAEVVQADTVVDELPAVLVAGADEDVQPALGRRPGEGGEDVVGLEAGHAEDGESHGSGRCRDSPSRRTGTTSTGATSGRVKRAAFPNASRTRPALGAVKTGSRADAGVPPAPRVAIVCCGRRFCRPVSHRRRTGV